MLDGLRKATQGAIGKFIMTIVMGLIIISFVVWGVGDMLRGFTATTVASVGSAKIEAQDYSQELRRRLYDLQQRMRKALTPAQARQLGLDQQVLSHMIDEAAFSERAKQMGLAVSESFVAQSVRDEPSLKGADGQFNRAAFDARLSQLGLNERGFFEEQRAAYVRREIEASLVAGLEPPKALVAAALDALNQTREIAYFTLDAASLGAIAPPDEATLKAYFEAHKAEWRTPETRDFDMLLVSPKTLAKPDAVSGAQAQAQYEKDKATRYSKPETRKLRQIVFASDAEAAEAAAKIAAGTAFDDIAKARKLEEKDVDLGDVNKAQVFDPAVAEAAFALKAGEVSAPVKGKFGVVLVTALAITPASVTPFEQVEGAIRQALAERQAGEEVQALHDKIEDARGNGKALAEAAKAAGLNAQSFTGIARDAKEPPAQVLPAVFASDVGVDDEALATKDRGYIWFSVKKISPAKDRALDEVKDKVAAAWVAGETAKRLADAAGAAVKALDGGAEIATIAGAAPVKTAKDVKRAGGEGISPELALAAFGVGPNGAGAQGNIVFKVTKDETPAPVAGDPRTEGTKAELKGVLEGSILEQYIGALRLRLGVTIDQRVLQTAGGG